MNLPSGNADHQITIEYKGVQIGLLISATPAIALTIGGIVRAGKQSTNRSDVLLSLSSSVQTDYEWHEFIEVSAFFTEREVQIKISANKSNLFEETITL
ncbi:MAG: hypothetical protein QGD92_14375 [Gammaproteobacteria bacterium]|nr:hypothetical protein [Gammaproteobacteria bacterium]